MPEHLTHTTDEHGLTTYWVGSVGPFYSRAVAAWYSGLLSDLKLARDVRRGRTVA